MACNEIGETLMGTIDTTARPVISDGFRLQWEPAQEAHVLLYPEGMVKLNQSAAAILTRCDGVHTIADIVGDVEATYALSGLTQDICAFISLALERTWLELPP
jgi:pyrroloquinoline quinone biosynthesis protein D